MKTAPSQAKDQEIVLVTGAGSGIGRQTALQLAQRGARVWVCGRREAPLRQLSDAEPNIHPKVVDITRAEDRATLSEEISEEEGRLDVLVNNAGVQNRIDFTRPVDPELVEREIATNLTAPVLLTAQLLPTLLRAPRPRIVNLSSGLALAPKASAPVYCATKAGLSNFSRALGFQLEPHGVSVMDVVTPLVKTPMTEGRQDGAMEAATFAKALVRAIDRPRAELYVGKSRLLPPLLRLAPSRAKRVLRNA